jgi:hypothetical protein
MVMQMVQEDNMYPSIFETVIQTTISVSCIRTHSVGVDELYIY